MQRRRFKQQLTLQDRLFAWSDEVHRQASKLRPGPEREALVRKARQADIAMQCSDWAGSTKSSDTRVTVRHQAAAPHGLHRVAETSSSAESSGRQDQKQPSSGRDAPRGT